MLNRIKKIIYLLPKGDSVKLSILLVLMLIAAGMEIAGIGMIPAFVAIVADPERIMTIEWIQPYLTFLDIQSNMELLIWGSIAMVTVFIIKSLYIIVYNYYESRYINRRGYFLRHQLMKSYSQAPYTFHLERNTAELLRNIIGEVSVIINIVLTGILKMAKEGILSISILIFLFSVEPLITLIVTLLSGLGSGTFILLNRNKLKQYGQEELDRREKMIKAINQGLGGIKEARVLNREHAFVESFRIEALKSSQLGTFIRFIKQMPKPLVETLAVVGMLIISLMLVMQGRTMATIVPILTLFAMATVRLMPSIQTLTSMYTNLKYNIVSLDPVYNDLKKLEESNTRFREDRAIKKQSFNLKNKIELKDVSYSYPDSDEPALKNVSLTIPRGQAVGFVGPSGAGKTTIVDLILGLLEPTEGKILVDGNDIHEQISAWQQNLGYIPQSIYLADETLRFNIAFGLSEDEIDDSRLKKSLELAQLKEMVGKLSAGLDTIGGEHGTRLSGGQRQRIGIARALYGEPQVLVMDEATSALDNITEKQITNAIESLKGDRTLIMIAHRLTTVMNCDKLYYMEDGCIKQEGTYNELVKTNKRFREMALEDHS